MSAGRALVVGYGRMGGFHAAVLDGLGYKVTTVDPDPARGADLTEIPVDRFSVACVAVPIRALAAAARLVAARTLPDFLLVEKPFASSAAEAIGLADDLRHTQAVGVGYVERFNPVVQRLVSETQDHLIESVEFTRLNDRPTMDPFLDLWSHDVDLAHHLARCGVDFDQVHYRVDGDRPHRVRCIQVSYAVGGTVTYDLMAHDGNPLREQWEAFLAGAGGVATPQDAIGVLRTIEATRTAEVAA